MVMIRLYYHSLSITHLYVYSDQFLKQQKLNRWVNCNFAIKEQVKQGFLLALQSSNPVVSHTAAQIIAAYGACDLPKQQWEALIPTLSHCIMKPDIAVQVLIDAYSLIRLYTHLFLPILRLKLRHYKQLATFVMIGHLILMR